MIGGGVEELNGPHHKGIRQRRDVAGAMESPQASRQRNTHRARPPVGPSPPGTWP